MKHLSEEELIELYYAAGAGNAPAAGHLSACAECAAALASLQNDLAGLETIVPPQRDDVYGERVWEAIVGSLPPRKRSLLRPGPWLRLGYAAAGLLVLASAFYAGRRWEQVRHPVLTAAKTPQPPPPHVVLYVLDEHLDRSERLLVQLKHADGRDPEALAPLGDEARSLLAANGARRSEAVQIGDPALATALGHLDRLLRELAAQPGGLNAEAIRHVQAEMNAEGLLFEMRILRSRMPDRQPGGHAVTNGGTI